MPRNFSELKSGGTIPMLSPHPEKWGGGARPPVPHRSTPVGACSWMWWMYRASPLQVSGVSFKGAFGGNRGAVANEFLVGFKEIYTRCRWGF